ncbi:carbonic anhydrase [Streptomyces sp. NPDC059009]|uniref:carbonic anhydrase n=1 Tax=Streptomyces sp. NPDC059009 TaxID=3346694 RepID=UPI00368381E8
MPNRRAFLTAATAALAIRPTPTTAATSHTTSADTPRTTSATAQRATSARARTASPAAPATASADAPRTTSATAPHTTSATTPYAPSAAVPRTASTPASAALDVLLAGNRRYATGRSRHPHEGRAVRHALADGQHPLAVVVGCIDSRAAPELVFDQGPGDLLCVRTAGACLDEAVLGSIQYGTAELDIPLVLVLGHERCGAVAATLARLRTGAAMPGHLRHLVDAIAPAARSCRGLPGDWAEHTLTAHTTRVRDTLRRDPALRPATVAAARCDLDSGRVRLLP